jgi:hypothetical protein
MRSVRLLALFALAVAPAIECSLNPQPLPPVMTGGGETAGSAEDASATMGSTPNGAAGDAGREAEDSQAGLAAGDASDAEASAADGETGVDADAGSIDASKEWTPDASSSEEASSD